MNDNIIPFSERRALPRNSAAFVAHIDRGEREPLPCTVLDMTFTGARIRAEDTALPDEFALLIDGGSFVKRSCRVVWREQYTVGVEFQERAERGV